MANDRLLDDWLSSYVEMTDNSEPPDQFRLWAGISTICAALQRKTYTEWEKPIYPNLYIVLIGPAGCRKGTAMAPAKSMLDMLGIKMAAESITREMLIREIAQSMEHCPSDERGVELHASLTIFSAELTVFIGQNNWQLISDLCDWFDCADRWVYRTKHQGEDEIIGVWVNLFAATTPDFLRHSLPDEAIGGGLSSRMIFIYGERGKVCPLPFLTSRQKELSNKLVHDLRLVNLMRGEFVMSDGFLDAYSDWYIRSADTPPFREKELLGYNERRALHVRKLAMVMSASRGDDMTLTVGDLERALMVLEDAEKRMPLVFKGRGRLRDSEVIEDILFLLRKKKRISISDLMERFYKEVSVDDMNKLVESLCVAKLARKEVSGGDTLIVYKGKA